MSVEPRDGALHARVTVRNTGGPAVTQPVRVDVDGATAAATEVRLGPGEQRDVELDVPAGDLVEAFLGGDDLLAADDHAVAVVGRRAAIDVGVVGDTLFWQEAAGGDPGRDRHRRHGAPLITTSSSSAACRSRPSQGRRSSPSPLPAACRRRRTARGIAVTGVATTPAVTLVRADDALLAGLDLSDVAVAEAQQVSAGDAEVLVAAEAAPLLLRGTSAGHSFAYVTFDLRDSNLAVQLAFPLLVDRLLGELTGVTTLTESLDVGERLPVPRTGAEVIGPDAEVRTVAAGDAAPIADSSGFWTIRAAGVPDVVVAVNPPSDESAIEPAVGAPAGAGRPADRRAGAPGVVAAGRGCCGHCSPSSPSRRSWRGGASASDAASGGRPSPSG